MMLYVTICYYNMLFTVWQSIDIDRVYLGRSLLAPWIAQQDIAGLATSFGTSVAQFLSFALSVPGSRNLEVSSKRIHEHHEPAENDRMNLDESIDSMAPIWDICFTNVQHSCISLASPTLVRYATVRGRLPPDAFCLGILVRCCGVTCLLCLFCGSILNFRGSMIVVKRLSMRFRSVDQSCFIPVS